MVVLKFLLKVNIDVYRWDIFRKGKGYGVTFYVGSIRS